ncbi:MAG: AraC family transcriptional regulator [Deltaproteobacteria bacterium]|nr:AraC family transcriptional regulator [Deltaproteobacteria bacterium]
MGTVEPDISIGAIRKLVETLGSLGVDPAAILAEARFNLADHADPESRVPLRTLYDLWEGLWRRLPRPDLALLAAQRYAPTDYGLLGFVSLSCPTIGAALEQVSRYSRLWTAEPELRLHADGWFSAEYTRPLPDRPGLRIGTEGALAEVLQAVRAVAPGPVSPTEVWFRHPAPSDTQAHEAFFGCKVKFGAARNAMMLPREALQMAMPRPDPQLGMFLGGLASKALEARAEPDSLLDQLRRLLAEELRSGVPNLQSTAKRLATSARTLRRKLETEGTTFRDLLDETRSKLAQSYLANPDLPLAEVAFLLGFSEASAFHRAFKRWTKQTPAEFREAALGARRTG